MKLLCAITYTSIISFFGTLSPMVVEVAKGHFTQYWRLLTGLVWISLLCCLSEVAFEEGCATANSYIRAFIILQVFEWWKVLGSLSFNMPFSQIYKGHYVLMFMLLFEFLKAQWQTWGWKLIFFSLIVSEKYTVIFCAVLILFCKLNFTYLIKWPNMHKA